MLDLLVLTVVGPLLGAGGVILSSSLFPKRDWKGRVVGALVAVVVLLVIVSVAFITLGGGEGRRIILSSPYPALLGGSAVELRWDDALKSLGLGFAVVVGVLLLETTNGETSLHLRAGVLMVLGTGLAALWSANPLTTIVSWAFYDFVVALARIAAGVRVENTLRSLALGTVSGLLLWTGVLVAEGGMGSVQWAFMPPGGTKMACWILAGFVRLEAYPLHLSFFGFDPSLSPVAGAFTLSPILGWALWIRLALVSDGVLPIGTWMILPALLTLVGGGVLAWTVNSAQESRSWISMGANGALLLATVLVSRGNGGYGGSETTVAVLTLGAIGWMLGTAVLFLNGGWELRRCLRWETLPRSIPSLIGASSLIGAPATAGFFVESYVIGKLVRDGRWSWLVGFLVGHALLVAGVVRWLLARNSMKGTDSGPLEKIVRIVGPMSLAVLLAVIGVLPDRLLPLEEFSFPVSLASLFIAPGVAGWLLWGSGALLGGVLAWFDTSLRPRISLWLDVVHDIVCLDWGFGLLTGAFEQGFGLLRAVDRILSGRGALLWSLILLLTLILVLGV